MTAKKQGSTDQLFARKGATVSLNRGPARDLLAADMLAFERAGGVVEKLGTTYTFKRIPPAETTHPTQVRMRSKARSTPS